MTPWDRVAAGAVRSHRRPGDTLTSSLCGLVRREELLKITGREVTEGEPAGGPVLLLMRTFSGLRKYFVSKIAGAFPGGASEQRGPLGL